MIRRLTILLLIVGCAPTKPTTANFYIGMTEKEFINNNPKLLENNRQYKNREIYVDKMV